MKLTDDYRNLCTKCGLCIDVCPQYDDIRIIDALCTYLDTETGAVLPSDDIRKCYTCNVCTVACPVGLGIRRLISAAREKNTRVNGPGEAQMIADPFSDKNIYLQIARWKKPIAFENEGKKSKVVYFPGCAATYMNQIMGKAAVRILKKAGVDCAVLSGADNCCGSVAYGAGNTGPIMKTGPGNIRKIRALGAETLVTTCPGCYRAFKNIYPALFGDPGFEVLQISEYILRLIGSGQLKFDPVDPSLFRKRAGPSASGIAAPLRIYYQDPCHLTRSVGMYEAPRQILQAVPGVVLVNPTPEGSVCCGFGGGVRTTFPGISLRQSGSVRKLAKEKGADIIITNCGGCMKNIIEGNVDREGKPVDDGIAVYDLAEFLYIASGQSPIERDDQKLVVLSNEALKECMSFYTFDPYEAVDTVSMKKDDSPSSGKAEPE